MSTGRTLSRALTNPAVISSLAQALFDSRDRDKGRYPSTNQFLLSCQTIFSSSMHTTAAILEDKDDARSLLKQIVQKLPDEESKRLDKIRRTRRQHIREVGAALALVAALVGGGLLAVLLSPVWAQIVTEENMETGVCKESGTCREWRVVFGISAAFSFAMAVITLIMTIVVVLGMHQLLAMAISAFILCLDSMSLALVATAYMTYPRSAAISAAVIMFLLGIFTLVVVAVPGAVLSWHLIFRLNTDTKNSTEEDEIDIKGEIYNNNGLSRNSMRYRGPTGKVGEDVLIHQAVKKDSWRYRLLLQMALANGEDPDRPSAEGITPLMLAAINEQEWAIDKLLEEGADRRMLQKDMAYLVVHCRDDHKEHMIENLQSKGVDFSRSIFYEIMVSAPHNKLDEKSINMKIVHLHELIQEIDINLREFSTGFTPLHFAVVQQNTRAVMELVDAPGIRLDIHDNEGYTALHRCLVQKEINFDILEGLLGCPHIDVVQETGKVNNTSLHLAVKSGSLRAVEMILQAIIGTSTTSESQGDVQVNNSPLMSEFVNKNNDARKSALHLAVEGGHVEIVETLLQHNGDPRRRNGEECNCLLIAAQHGYASVVSLLLNSEKVDPMVCGKREGKTALHFACSARSLPTVRELLRKPVVRKKINFGDKAGFTALHHAVESGSYEIVRILLKVDEIDPNEPSNDDRYPIHLAASKNDTAILKLLLDHKRTNVNVCGSAGQTAFDIAKEFGYKEIESILVSRNGMRASDIDVSMNQSKIAVDTVLHRLLEMNEIRFATEEELSWKIQDVLGQGNDINVRDQKGRTPLHNAARGGYLEILKALLNQKGINVNAEDRKGYTPLQIACKKGNLLVVKELLGLNQAPNASSKHEAHKRDKTSAGNKTLLRASEVKNQENHRRERRSSEEKPRRESFQSYRNIQKMAEEVKSELENETKDLRRTPLELAIEHGHLEVAEILLEQGADIHHTANDGMGCLHLACRKGDLKMVQKLLNMKVNIKGQDDLGKSELHYACESGNVDVVDALLQLPGIEVNKLDHDYYTPWHLAASQHHSNASKILKRLLAYTGIDVNKKGPKEKSALHLAVEAGNVDTVKVILAAPGININARDKDGMTPLHVGARKANGEIVSLLIKTHPKDIDVNIRSNNGLTPMDAAFVAGNTKGKNILRRHGALRSVEQSHSRSTKKSMNLPV